MLLASSLFPIIPLSFIFIFLCIFLWLFLRKIFRDDHGNGSSPEPDGTWVNERRRSFALNVRDIPVGFANASSVYEREHVASWSTLVVLHGRQLTHSDVPFSSRLFRQIPIVLTPYKNARFSQRQHPRIYLEESRVGRRPFRLALQRTRRRLSFTHGRAFCFARCEAPQEQNNTWCASMKTDFSPFPFHLALEEAEMRQRYRNAAHASSSFFPLFFRANRIISIHLEKNITATHATAWRPFFVVVYCLASNKLLRLSLSIRIVFIPLSRRRCWRCCFIRDGVTSSLPLLAYLFKLTLNSFHIFFPPRFRFDRKRLDSFGVDLLTRVSMEKAAK